MTAWFRYGHIDRPPLTRMAETMMMLVFGHPDVGFTYRHRRDGRDFRFDSLRHIAKGGGGRVRPEDISTVRRALDTGLRRIGAS